jgi:hypothetical protein
MFSGFLPAFGSIGIDRAHRGANRVSRDALRNLAFAVLLATSLLTGQAEAQSGKSTLLLISLDPLAIPIVVESKIKGTITISLKLHLLDPEVEKDVRKLKPKLKDTFLNYMYRYGASSSARGVLKLNTIMNQFQSMTDKQFGKDKIKVLVHSVEHSRKTR